MTARGTKVPKWAKSPFKRFASQAQRLAEVIDISARGMSLLPGMPGLSKLVESEPEGDRSTLETAESEAQLAEREVETGFPVLYSWAVVGQWAQLEAFIRQFVASRLRRKPSSWKLPPIAKLRIRLGEYESIPRDQHHLYITQVLEQELGAGKQQGCSRFESMLEPFELSGPVPEALGKAIFELGQVRNAIAHNGGRVDRRLAESCPRLRLKPGDMLAVTRAMFQRYNGPAMAYVYLVFCRVGERYGRNMIENRKKVDAMLRALIPEGGRRSN
jgi:hypothetical protein